MKFLFRLFPVSRSATNTASLVLSFLLYLAAAVLVHLVFSLVDWLPLLGKLFVLLTRLVNLYCLAGMILSILLYCHIVKK